ncbi:hypothetical protein [Streptomyces sp. NBC_00989]|uniref:hypothetical protein n=1 Tax=Streptomyces sp. NBC_00989 TaxID=2903705 RepID=UPI00386A5A20|nr:hypothetical protein OG714_05000 [Streptomyces sp. NBC_00989]
MRSWSDGTSCFGKGASPALALPAMQSIRASAVASFHGAGSVISTTPWPSSVSRPTTRSSATTALGSSSSSPLSVQDAHRKDPYGGRTAASRNDPVCGAP